MSDAGKTSNPLATRDLILVAMRFLLGGLFIYMGLSKALHPVEFLKLIRQYDVLHHHLALNLTAVALPWLEIFCGTLLVLGIAVRGTSLIFAVLLVIFSVLVTIRALAIREAGGPPFCAIKFDCGCGAGEVLVCRKLPENALLLALSIALVYARNHRACLKAKLA